MSFMNWVYKIKPVRISKHQASKKGFAHKHNPSRGEQNHLKFIGK